MVPQTISRGGAIALPPPISAEVVQPGRCQGEKPRGAPAEVVRPGRYQGRGDSLRSTPAWAEVVQPEGCQGDDDGGRRHPGSPPPPGLKCYGQEGAKGTTAGENRPAAWPLHRLSSGGREAQTLRTQRNESRGPAGNRVWFPSRHFQLMASGAGSGTSAPLRPAPVPAPPAAGIGVGVGSVWGPPTGPDPQGFARGAAVAETWAGRRVEAGATGPRVTASSAPAR